MSDEPRLTPAEIAYLNRLGQAIRACPGARERDQSLRFVLNTCRDYRARGVPAAAIARALEIDTATMLEWLLADTPKPSTPPATPRPAEQIDDRPAEHRFPFQARHTTQSLSRSQSQPAMINVASHATGFIEQPSRITQPPHTPRRTLLAISGDPRPGQNVFGLEMAAIRAGLGMLSIDVRELSCPDLAELTTQLRRGPTIVHIAAHNASSGLALTFEQHGSSIGWDQLADTILDTPTAPKLIVLNVCASVPLGKRLASDGVPVLSWPTAVTDEQARQMTTLLYRQLATGSTIGQAHSEACATLSPRWPGLNQPLLHGTRDARPL